MTICTPHDRPPPPPAADCRPDARWSALLPSLHLALPNPPSLPPSRPLAPTALLTQTLTFLPEHLPAYLNTYLPPFLPFRPRLPSASAFTSFYLNLPPSLPTFRSLCPPYLKTYLSTFLPLFPHLPPYLAYTFKSPNSSSLFFLPPYPPTLFTSFSFLSFLPSTFSISST